MTSKMSREIEPIVRIRPAIIEGVEVAIEAFAGAARMTIGELSALKQGDIVALDRSIGSDVELRLNGVAIATGELVAVEEMFGVRITAIASE